MRNPRSNCCRSSRGRGPGRGRVTATAIATAGLLCACAEAKIGDPSSNGDDTADARSTGDGSIVDGTLGAIDATSPPDAENCVCLSGPCCDGCHFLPATTRCDVDPVAVAYRCTSALCGADAEYQEQIPYCSGASDQCGNDNLVWEAWQLLEDCSTNALCASDSGGASCSACSSGCAGDACACGQGGNVALSGSMSMSDGSFDLVNYGPHKMNDGQSETSCGFSWVSAYPVPDTEAWIRIDWASPQQLWGLAIDTVALSGSSCDVQTGRALAGGTVQWWDGANWVTDGIVSDKTNDWSYQFSAPVTTTAVRIDGVYPAAVDNPVIFEWQLFACN